MNLADTFRFKSGQSIELASNAAAILWVESQDNKRIVIKRPRPENKDLLGFSKCWKLEQETTQELSHPNILKVTSEEEDGSMMMERLSLISLYEFMADNPSFVTQQSELDRIIDELMNVLNFLHQRSIYMIDLNPHNILLTKSGKSIKIFATGSQYLSIRKELWPERTEYIAPELQEDNVTINQRADIYALGKIIEFIFSYGKLPFKYKSIVSRCLEMDPMNRFVSIQTMKSALARRAKLQQMRNSLIIMAVVGVLAAIGIWWSNSNQTEPYEHVDPALNSDNTVSVIEARQQYGINEDSLAAFLGDTIYTDEEWAVSDSIKDKLSTIFRRQFRQKASPVINKIYNQQIVNGTGNNFQIAITQGYEDLKLVKEQLIREIGLDEVTADKIASEVISDLAEKRLRGHQ